MKRIYYLVLLITGILLLTTCSKDKDINFFSVNQDIEFGRQLDSTIMANPSEYPILSATQYPDAYTYINDMKDDILASSEILYKEEFVWQVKIINKNIKNAFAAPGGYIYVYTGLMKYLDNSAQLAGILAHEIAHADRRHSTEQLTKTYSFAILLNIVLGKDQSQLAQIASQMALGASSLAFSRAHEYEADEFSIRYLSTTRFNPKGIAGFFIKLQNEGQTAETFEFLSTHPTDEHRLANMDEVCQKYNITIPTDDSKDFVSEYNTIITTKIPQ